MGKTGFDINLHDGRELNLEVKPVDSVDHNIKCGWAEDCDIICREYKDY